MRRFWPAALVLAALLAAAAPAAAHSTSTPAPAAVATAVVVLEALPDHQLVSGAPAATLPWTALALVAAVALAAARRPRRAVAIALVLMVGLIAFETGVHAVHHLGDDSARCVVAWMSSQLSGATVAVAADAAPVALDHARITAPAPPHVAGHALAPDAGRAPPA
jgi:hypothetical protein